MGRLRLFGELVEGGGAVERGASGGGGGGEPHLPAAVAGHRLALVPAGQHPNHAPRIRRDRDQVGANQ